MKVPKIIAVNLGVISGDSSHLSVAATAEVPTLGWSEPQIVPYHYYVPPADGIYDFDFLANPPAGVAAQQVTVLPATTLARKPLKGVRIHSSGNQFVVRLVTVASGTTPEGDDIRVSQARIEGDHLKIDVSYSGGCERHFFELFWDGIYLESLPPQVSMKLMHHANGDTCRRLVHETLVFDLLDLDPCVIHLSTEFGYSSSIDYRVRGLLRLPLLRGNNAVQILSNPEFTQFVTRLTQDNSNFAEFEADPVGVLKSGGFSRELELIQGRRNDGIVIILKEPSSSHDALSGMSTVLRKLAISNDVQYGDIIIFFNGSSTIL